MKPTIEDLVFSASMSLTSSNLNIKCLCSREEQIGMRFGTESLRPVSLPLLFPSCVDTYFKMYVSTYVTERILLNSSSSNDLHSPSWLPDLSLLHLRNDSFEILLIDFPRPAQDMQLFYDLFD